MIGESGLRGAFAVDPPSASKFAVDPDLRMRDGVIAIQTIAIKS
jgi:hypothetical protein